MSEVQWSLAACRDQPHSLWFPERGDSGKAAKTVCYTQCPIRQDCLQWALDTRQEHGIWGGLSWEQRDRERTYRTVTCAECRAEFRWIRGESGSHVPPRYCSAECRRKARKRQTSGKLPSSVLT